MARPPEERVRRHPRRPRRYRRGVLAAIQATVKGGIGKLRERPQGKRYKEGERWPAPQRPTWRPDIRAAVISRARVNMHRKMRNMATMTGLYPLAVLSDRVVCPPPGASPLDFLPYAASGKPQPGGFRLGPTPGLGKLEGVQSMPGHRTHRRQPQRHDYLDLDY